MSGYNCDYCGRNFDSDEDHLCGADLHRLYVQRDALRAEVERLRRVVEAVVAYVPTVPPCSCIRRSCPRCVAFDRMVREVPRWALDAAEVKR